MPTISYLERRDQLTTYFDRTAVDAWSKLTSDAPVGRIRRTVRAGRDAMRTTLLAMLPEDLAGRRILDAGCGTGLLAYEAARRGAHVTAIDLSPTLINLARDRMPDDFDAIRRRGGAVEFKAGDMLSPALGRFDHVVAMDSLIHYSAPDTIKALAGLAQRVDRSILFTFAPRTPVLAAMHAVGRLFPRSDRAPAIQPVREDAIVRMVHDEPRLAAWRTSRTQRIAQGFYTSQVLELMRAS
jgi:magnesium-protoporphyrin O-methyltransferase